jgi:tRNA(adenine34) deaminase
MCLGAAFTMRLGAIVYALESPSDGGCEALTAWDNTRQRDSLPGHGLPRLHAGIKRLESAKLFREFASTSEPGWATRWAAELAELAGV